MFYQLIQQKVEEWFRQDDCPARRLVDYIMQRGMMRDAQIAAIRTFLYLKIACGNQPLASLFCEGRFNGPAPDYDDMPLSTAARKALKKHGAAEALFQYAQTKDRKGKPLSKELEEFITVHSDEIDYDQSFRDIFYGISYPDYVFSLPMGAGKTFLMAAFIYLDLYLALQDPENPAFAHNFMVMAPSGLKTSIIPSIKHIQDFDPTWVMPDPTATKLRRMISFEVLDEQKTSNKSNLVKNPNAQKINNHQPLHDCWGLVAVTNAEKVILDRLDKDADNNLFHENPTEWNHIRCSNELRDIIGRIPHLAVYIDEVHHASDGDIKLRQVVNHWMESTKDDDDGFNGVLGFSGTPYLKSAEKITLGDTFDIKDTSLSNVVYHYPLVSGVGNFLKRPTIKTTDNTQEAIITKGVEEFLDHFGSRVYANGTKAKLAIYCSRIENLEETVYPLVAALVSKRGMNPQDTILKYHGGNKQYATPAGAAAAFAALDTDFSPYRIVLLAQIGKEGWDCKSLTSVILPQKGACPQNMVLQTSCRCLRQVIKGDTEERALIWLNDDNAKVLNKELQRQQDTDIDTLNRAADNKKPQIDRYVRHEVPPIDFYQLQIHYNTLIIAEENDAARRLAALDMETQAPMAQSVIREAHDLSGHMVNETLAHVRQEGETAPVSYHQWLLRISKESMGMLKPSDFQPCEERLRQLFEQASEQNPEDGLRYLRADIDQQRLRALIRRCFAPERTIETRKDTLRREASILKVENLTSPLVVESDRNFFPDQSIVHKIIHDDQSHPTEDEETKKARGYLEYLRNMNLPGVEDMIKKVEEQVEGRGKNVSVRDKTYHYIPYHFDSNFEISYFSDQLLSIVGNKPLEVYFNGDDTLTDFRIACYSHRGDDWHYIGCYVPDFLMLSRKEDGTIDRVLIIETKGEGFAPLFRERRDFMSQEFVRLNNDKFGYRRFDFLYIEDTMTVNEQSTVTLQKIKDFFQL